MNILSVCKTDFFDWKFGITGDLTIWIRSNEPHHSSISKQKENGRQLNKKPWQNRIIFLNLKIKNWLPVADFWLRPLQIRKNFWVKNVDVATKTRVFWHLRGGTSYSGSESCLEWKISSLLSDPDGHGPNTERIDLILGLIKLDTVIPNFTFPSSYPYPLPTAFRQKNWNLQKGVFSFKNQSAVLIRTNVRKCVKFSNHPLGSSQIPTKYL